MDGLMTQGWYDHPQLGLIKIFENKKNNWVFVCYSKKGTRILSKERALDQWTWALCESSQRDDLPEVL